MNAEPNEKFAGYLREAGTWARDRAVDAERSRRLAWTLASIAIVIAGLEALALAALAPLKTVVPYTVLVDRHTGYVTAIDPLKPTTLSADTALTNSFLAQYVTARETFDISSLNADYRKVTGWSAETARRSYVGVMQASNPESPLNLYPRSTVVETRIKSISPLANNTALVRFDTVRSDVGASQQRIQPWVAVIGYRWSGAPRTAEARLVNPLGFEVVRYRRDAEALPTLQANATAQPSLTSIVNDPSVVSGAASQ